jgi:transcriptional regulator with XRE-family HTH domain
MTSEADKPARSDLLGSYIRAQREMADLSQRQLSGLSNVSNAYLSQLERGLHQPSVAVLRAIASALNLSGEALLAQAGLLNPDASVARSIRGVEEEILADPQLTEEEKQVLAGVYRNFLQRHDEQDT